MIRQAGHEDIPGIIALGRHALGESKLAGAEFDEDMTAALLARATALQGEPVAGSACLLVAEDDGLIVGMLIGVVRPYYEVLSVNYATSLLFYVLPGSDRSIADGLLDRFEAWVGDSAELIMTASDTILNPAVVTRWLRRRGYTRLVAGNYMKEAK